MSTQLKKGFTLIELMVVVIIIGILAAIAIPKLFGMTAKAKAQEVGTTTGTWVKLQQAYSTETGTQGSNARIGFTSPGTPGSITSPATGATAKYSATSETTYFTYSNNITGTSVATALATTDTSSTATLTAMTTKSIGNGCDAAKTWTATITASNGQVVAVANDTDCAALTPNFANIK